MIHPQNNWIYLSIPHVVGFYQLNALQWFRFVINQMNCIKNNGIIRCITRTKLSKNDIPVYDLRYYKGDIKPRVIIGHICIHKRKNILIHNGKKPRYPRLLTFFIALLLCYLDIIPEKQSEIRKEQGRNHYNLNIVHVIPE